MNCYKGYYIEYLYALYTNNNTHTIYLFYITRQYYNLDFNHHLHD